MTLVLSLAVAVLFGSGAYLLLKHDLIRVVAGILLISNAANLFIMSAGLSRGAAPIYPLPEQVRVADPLVQAMTLTAIVITFGVTALLLALIYRVYLAHTTFDSESLAAQEIDQELGEERALDDVEPEVDDLVLTHEAGTR
ncbi:MAG: NADH-quinone oxidoreductase subunit K [Thermomicrobiales bacterium]